MKRLYNFVISSIISGVFFLIPIGIIVIIFEKIFHLTKRLQIALHLNISEKTYMQGLINDVIIVVFVLTLCFIGGILAKVKLGKMLIAKIENDVLKHLPGYNYAKAAAQEVLGVSGHNFQNVVLFRDDEGKYQLGFKVEEVTDLMVMVFMPSVPKPQDGEMLIVNKNRLIETDLTMQQAFTLMRSMGAGGGKILSKFFNESNSG